jgi:putative ABC transport system substrate-binding protein
MRRREFMAGVGSVAAWPVAARAQQAALPVVGLVSLAAADVFADLAVYLTPPPPTYSVRA